MTIAAKEFSTTGFWRGVYFDGPSADLTQDGDEIPVWVVYIGDDEAEPLGTIYKCHDYAEAERLARRISTERGFDLIHDASPA